MESGHTIQGVDPADDEEMARGVFHEAQLFAKLFMDHLNHEDMDKHERQVVKVVAIV